MLEIECSQASGYNYNNQSTFIWWYQFVERTNIEKELFITLVLNMVLVGIAVVMYLLDLFGNKLLLSETITKSFKMSSRDILIVKIVLGIIVIYLFYVTFILGFLDIKLLKEGNISRIDGYADNTVQENKYFSDLKIQTDKDNMTIHIRKPQKDVNKGDYITVYYLKNTKQGVIAQ